MARRALWGADSPPAAVIYFFDPQSPECLLEMSFLDALYLRARDFGLAVYAIEARGRQPAEVRRSLERYCSVYQDPSFPVLPDPSFRTGRTYGVERLPVTFVTESHGVILNRIEGYDHAAAVAITRRVEQLLRRTRGHFTPALREAGVSAAEEQEAEERIAAAARPGVPVARALDVGDRVSDLDFTDVLGRSGRWTWSQEAGKGLRIVAFFAGLTLTSVEELTWLDGLARRGRDADLEVLAVEASGLDAAALQVALEKYRRYNPEPSFPVIPDPDGRIARVFGPWEQLPQTYLLAADGAVVYRAEGFSVGEGEIVTGKVERAFSHMGRPFPSPEAAGGSAVPTTVGDEAPSIRRRQEQDERLRVSLVQADAAFISWDFERALMHYQDALEVQPTHLHTLERIAQIHERRGDAGLALRAWERVLAVQPDHVEAATRARELRGR